jgi:uncharacterized membrane protein HdeD (DUF308 family)
MSIVITKKIVRWILSFVGGFLIVGALKASREEHEWLFILLIIVGLSCIVISFTWLKDSPKMPVK